MLNLLPSQNKLAHIHRRRVLVADIPHKHVPRRIPARQLVSQPMIPQRGHLRLVPHQPPRLLPHPIRRRNPRVVVPNAPLPIPHRQHRVVPRHRAHLRARAEPRHRLVRLVDVVHVDLVPPRRRREEVRVVGARGGEERQPAVLFGDLGELGGRGGGGEGLAVDAVLAREEDDVGGGAGEGDGEGGVDAGWEGVVEGGAGGLEVGARADLGDDGRLGVEELAPQGG